MPSVDVGTATLFYEERGSGAPLVLVHGIPTDYRAWASQTAPLSKDNRVIAVSRRYATPNSRQGDLSDSTVGNNALDLKNFIERLGVAPVHLVGHSYGGFISAVLTADHPDLVRSLILVEPAVSTLLVANQKSAAAVLSLLLRSPSVAMSARKFQSGSLKPSLRALQRGDMRRAVELNVDGVQDAPGSFAKLPEDVRTMMLENARTIGELDTEFPRFTAEEARRISCRTLVLNGELSPLWLRKIGALVAKHVPNAEALKVPAAHHFPHVENPDAFNELVLAFLGKVGR